MYTIDRLIVSQGEKIMLPMIGSLVQKTMQNDKDWRYKHAAMMAFS
jgi:hypothetical protein